MVRVAATRYKKMTFRPPEYKPPPRRAYSDLGWVCAALSGPATFVAAWIYCAVIYGFLLGLFFGWIPALILALVVAVMTIYLWPFVVVALLYVIYRALGCTRNCWPTLELSLPFWRSR